MSSNFKERIIAETEDIDYSNVPASQSTIEMVESILKVKMGEELKAYLTEFGYLGCGAVEFYGVNERQTIKSDLVTATQLLHNVSEDLKGFVAIESLGDDVYAVCDGLDSMYQVNVAGAVRVRPLNIDLLGYSLMRLKA